ncbi:glycine cleavage system protein H [Streptomyces albidoflavus]
MSVPAELKYTEEHMWVGVPEGGRARAGLAHFAQSQLGDVVYVELPQVGQVIEVGQAMGQVSSRTTPPR